MIHLVARIGCGQAKSTYIDQKREDW